MIQRGFPHFVFSPHTNTPVGTLAGRKLHGKSCCILRLQASVEIKALFHHLPRISKASVLKRWRSATGEVNLWECVLRLCKVGGEGTVGGSQQRLGCLISHPLWTLPLVPLRVPNSRGIISASAAHITSTCWGFSAPEPSFFNTTPIFFPTLLLPCHASLLNHFLLPLPPCIPLFFSVFSSVCAFTYFFLYTLPPLLNASPNSPPPPFHCKLTTNPSFSHYLSPHLPLSSLFLILLCFPFFPFSKLQILFSFCLLLLLHFDLRCQAPFLPSHPILSYPILSCLSWVLSPCWVPLAPEIQSDNARPIRQAEASSLQDCLHRATTFCRCHVWGPQKVSVHGSFRKHNIRSENICHNLLFISCRPHFDTSFFFPFTINDGSWELDANFRHEKCVLLHFTLYFSCLFLLCYENRYFAF